MNLIKSDANTIKPAAVTAAILMLATAALAQYPVSQNGRLFDASNTAGGSRYNYSQPASPLLGGNPFATGNVGRGLSLRTVSPVVDPTTFRAVLGSDSLSNFRRDSIATGYASDPGGGLTAGAFFDPSRTAPSSAYLQGYYDFSPATPAWTANDAWTGAQSTPGVSSQYGAPPAMQPDFTSYLSRRAAQVDNALDTSLNSALFGAQPLRLPSPYDRQASLPQNLNVIPQAQADSWNAEASQTYNDQFGGPLDLRINPQTPTDNVAPLDVLMRENAARLLTERNVGVIQPEDADAATNALSELPFASRAESTLPDQTPLGPHIGGDVFTDMQMALELSQNPQAEWFAEMQHAVGRGSSPVVSEQALEQQQQASVAAEAFLAGLFESQIETFVGEDPSALNQEMDKAETAMDMGRFYEAVQRYERARMIDPANPLPLLGKGHAQLAAGEYVSAAVNILAGLERYPSISEFQVNLTSLIGGGETVDIRRADLIKQLKRNEDPLLRFLLGYLELHAGMPASGLQHLEKAASEALPGSMIRKYPDLVRRQAYFAPNRPASLNQDAVRDPENDSGAIGVPE